MITLKLIDKINYFKKIENINLHNNNYSYLCLNILNQNKLITITEAEFYLINKNNKIFNIAYIYHDLNFLIKKHIDITFENLNFNLYREFNLNNIYTNYNISMLYAISLLNSDTSSIFDLDYNSTLNIRKPFKASNSNLLKKTLILDSILKKYIESILESKVSINFDKYGIEFSKKKNIFLRVLRRRMRRLRKLLRYSDVSLRNFIRITFIFMYTKDIDIFSKVLVKIMSSMHYKNHRRFLYYLKLFISKSMNFFFELLKFQGFFFYLSGKISGGGNSKKKHYVVKHGKYSLTNKMLKIKYKKGLIHTKTGVMGYKFIVSYK